MILGFQEYQIGWLVAAKLLPTLGRGDGPKWFALAEILALRDDKEWLHRATLYVQKHIKKNNAKRHEKLAQEQA